MLTRADLTASRLERKAGACHRCRRPGPPRCRRRRRRVAQSGHLLPRVSRPSSKQRYWQQQQHTSARLLPDPCATSRRGGPRRPNRARPAGTRRRRECHRASTSATAPGSAAVAALLMPWREPRPAVGAASTSSGGRSDPCRGGMRGRRLGSGSVPDRGTSGHVYHYRLDVSVLLVRIGPGYAGGEGGRNAQLERIVFRLENVRHRHGELRVM